MSTDAENQRPGDEPLPNDGVEPQTPDPEVVEEYRKRFQESHERHMQIAARRQNLDIAQRAVLRPMTVEDLSKGVQELYEKARLSEDAIRGVLRRDKRPFEKEMQGGVMIYGFDENPINPSGKQAYPSVRETMREQLERTAMGDETFGRYHGAVLEGQDGKTLGWATWQLPPRMPHGSKYRDMMGSLLEHGVTGGGLQYMHGKRAESYLSNIQEMVMFDTIISPHRFAAHRLMRDSTRDIVRTMDRSSRREWLFMLYRLGDVKFQLTMPHKPVFEGLVPVGNKGSESFFREMGCSNIASEENKEGPLSRRDVDENTVFVQPSWAWMVGYLDDVQRNSDTAWNDIQRTGGIRKSGAENPPR